MPLILIALGIALLIAASRNTLQAADGQSGFLDLLKADFVGPGNFFSWIVAIGVVGALGYYKPLRPLSVAFMILIIIVFLLAANKGGKDFFSSLQNQLIGRQVQNNASNSAGLNTGVLNPIPNTLLNDPALNVLPFNPVPIGAS